MKMADRFASQGYSLKKKNKLGDQMITDLADYLPQPSALANN